MANEVIILARSLPFHHLGGMEIVAWDLAVELQNKGFQTKVITTDFTGNAMHHTTPAPEIIRIKDVPSAKYSKGWWRKSEALLADWENKENVCGIISISAGAFSALKLKKKFPNAKFIMQAHGTSVGEVLSKLKTRKIKKILSAFKNVLGFWSDAQHYKYFDWIVAVGEAVQKDLLSFPTNIICDKRQVIKIENGIDQNLFTDAIHERGNIRKALNIPDEALVFLSASRLHEQKGVDLNIDLFARIKKKISNAKYLICGDGPYEAELRKQVQNLNLTDDVLFLGAKTRSELALIMQGADVFLFLTKRIEGLPLNILEAMSAGLPLVLSEHLNFTNGNKIYKCDAGHINLDELLKYINAALAESRKTFIPAKNTLDHAVEQYVSLLQSHIK